MLLGGICGAVSGAGATLVGATGVGSTFEGACGAGATLVGATGVGSTFEGACGAGATLVGATGVGITLAGAWAAGRVLAGAWAWTSVTSPRLRNEAATQPITLRSLIDAVSHDSSCPECLDRRDRIHAVFHRVDPLYGIIVCVLWEFYEFSSEYIDFSAKANKSKTKTWIALKLKKTVSKILRHC
jgi:hypothetical protein